VSRAPRAGILVLPGAGSAGAAWQAVADAVEAEVVPVPVEPDVPAMAAALAARVEAVRTPRVLAGASLGAMVALELARRVRVDGLVLVAAGFGIEVAPGMLEWVEANPPDLFPKLARAGLADPDEARLATIREADFAARGQAVLLAHLRALGAYRPEPLADPPPTCVLWGEHDRGVPLEDHVALALRCGGVLVPVAGAGHAPFLERPHEVVKWILRMASIAP
jgi:pimeloyl-ACP methyl ester carboxylesterase